jgi:hypothetical protein
MYSLWLRAIFKTSVTHVLTILCFGTLATSAWTKTILDGLRYLLQRVAIPTVHQA